MALGSHLLGSDAWNLSLVSSSEHMNSSKVVIKVGVFGDGGGRMVYTQGCAAHGQWPTTHLAYFFVLQTQSNLLFNKHEHTAHNPCPLAGVQGQSWRNLGSIQHLSVCFATVLLLMVETVEVETAADESEPDSSNQHSCTFCGHNYAYNTAGCKHLLCTVEYVESNNELVTAPDHPIVASCMSALTLNHHTPHVRIIIHPLTNSLHHITYMSKHKLTTKSSPTLLHSLI